MLPVMQTLACGYRLTKSKEHVTSCHSAVEAINVRCMISKLVPFFLGSSMARCVMEVVRQVVTVPLLQVLRQFGHMAARYRICVGAEVLLPSITRLASLSTVTW